MRAIFSIILFLLLSVNINFYGQVARTYEEGKEPSEKVIISGGKPVFVIAISPTWVSDSLVIDREKNELKENFKNLNPNVKIEYTDVVVFKNKNIRKFDFRNSEESGQRILYWDGKVDSQPILYESLMYSTEFFSEQLGLNLVSSYVANFEKLKEEYLTPPEEKITKKSKEVFDIFLNKTIMSYLFYLEKGSENFYKMNFKGIKSIKAVPSTTVKDVVPMEITFNEEGLPINMNYILEKKVNNFDFQYENGLLKNFNNKGQFYYVDDKIIIINEDTRTVFTIKDNDFLLQRSDTFYDDTKKISWREIDLEGNRISYKEDGGLNNSTFDMSSRENIFPVSQFVAHSKEENIYEKKGSEIIEIYHPDNKIFIWTLNEKGLIEKFSVNDQDAKEKIEIKYLYEYYK